MPSCLKHILPALLTTLLLSACASLPPANPQHAQALGQQADALIPKADFATAGALYGEATRYDPTNPHYWLMWAEMLEADNDPDGAADALHDALDLLPANEKQRAYLAYRLGLLLAGPLHKPLEAQDLRDQVLNEAARNDLDAMIALASGRDLDALRLLAHAVTLTDDLDQRGRIYYHASAIHAQRGNLQESRKELFHAVNSASSPALKVAIRRLFDELQAADEKRP